MSRLFQNSSGIIEYEEGSGCVHDIFTGGEEILRDQLDAEKSNLKSLIDNALQVTGNYLVTQVQQSEAQYKKDTDAELNRIAEDNHRTYTAAQADRVLPQASEVQQIRNKVQCQDISDSLNSSGIKHNDDQFKPTHKFKSIKPFDTQQSINRAIEHSMRQIIEQRNERARSRSNSRNQPVAHSTIRSSSPINNYISPYSQRAMSASKQNNGPYGLMPQRPGSPRGVNLSVSKNYLGSVDVIVQDRRYTVDLPSNGNSYVIASEFVRNNKLNPVIVEALSNRLKGIIRTMEQERIGNVEYMNRAQALGPIVLDSLLAPSGTAEEQNTLSFTKNQDLNVPAHVSPSRQSVYILPEAKKLSKAELNSSINRLYRGSSPSKKTRVSQELSELQQSHHERSLSSGNQKAFERLYNAGRSSSLLRSGMQKSLLLERKNSLCDSDERPFIPQIDPKSREFSKPRWEKIKESLQGGGNFGTFLFNEEKQLKHTRDERIKGLLEKQEEALKKEMTLTPEISSLAHRLDRGTKSVTQKLLLLKKSNDEKIRNKAAELEKQEMDGCTFSPQILRGPENRAVAGRLGQGQSPKKSIYEDLYGQAELLDKKRVEIQKQPPDTPTFTPQITSREESKGMMVRVERMLSDWQRRQFELQQIQACPDAEPRSGMLEPQLGSSLMSDPYGPYTPNQERRLLYDELFKEAELKETRRIQTLLQESLKDKIICNVSHLNRTSRNIVTNSRRTTIADVFCLIADNGLLDLTNGRSPNLDILIDADCRRDVAAALNGVNDKIDLAGFIYLMERHLEQVPMPRRWLISI